jgi:hypothetical protein
MANRVTPFVKRMRTQGGTIYTFSSAVEDIGLNINERNNVVKISNFALLNIPPINHSLNYKENYFNVNAIDGTWKYNGASASIKDGRLLIAESFQNYALNLETLLLSQTGYNSTLSNTVSERVFWKWLKETGAIRFVPVDTSAGLKWIEELDIDGSAGYNTVVKCIGAVSAGNVRSDTYGTYNETYVLVPTSYGQTAVYFNQVEDENYYHGKIISGGTVNISGRETYTLPHPDGLEYKAYYDYTDSSISAGAYTLQYDQSTGSYNTGWWFTPYSSLVNNANAESYLIDSSSYINTRIYHTNLRYNGGSADFGFRRSTVDCLSIVYDLNTLRDIYQSNDSAFSYDDISLPPNSVNDNFEFNAVLIYYSVYNSTMDVKLATNLLGILFLDVPLGNSSNIGNTGITIPSLTKLQSNAAGFGTSYSLRLNIKTDTLIDNTNAVIYDETTSAQTVAEDFIPVFSNLNYAVELLSKQAGTINYISEQYGTLASQQQQILNDVTELQSQSGGSGGGSSSTIIGTPGAMAMFSGGDPALGESVLSDSSIYMYLGNLGFFTSSPTYKFQVDVSMKVKDIIIENAIRDIDGNVLMGYGSPLTFGSVNPTTDRPIWFHNGNPLPTMTIDSSEVTVFGKLNISDGSIFYNDVDIKNIFVPKNYVDACLGQFIRSTSTGSGIVWSAGFFYVDVSVVAGGVSLAYVDGSLAVRDANISNLTIRENATDTSLSIITQRYDKTEVSVGAITSRHNATEASVNTINNRVNATDTSVARLTNRVNTTDVSVSSLNNRTSSLESSIGTFATNASVNTAFGEYATNASVNAAIGDFTTNTSVNAAITKVNNRNNITDTSLYSLTNRVNETDLSVNRVTIKLDACIGNLTTRVATADTSLSRLTSRVNTTDTSLSAATGRINTSDTSLNTLTGRTNTIDTSLNILFAKVVITDTSLNTITNRVTNDEASIAWLANYMLPEASLGSGLTWAAGYIIVDVSTVAGGVTKAYVDGSLASRDTTISTMATNASIGLAGFAKNVSFNSYTPTTVLNASLGVYPLNSSVNTAFTQYPTNASVNTAFTQYPTNASVNTAFGGYATNASIGLANFANNASFNSYPTNSSVNTAFTQYTTNVAFNTSIGAYATNASIGLAAFAKNASFASYTTILAFNSSIGPLTTKVNTIDTSLSTLTTRVTNNDTSIAWLANYMLPESSLGSGLTWSGGYIVVDVSTVAGGVTKVYVDSSLVSRDISINSLYAKYDKTETSVGTLTTRINTIDNSLNILFAKVLTTDISLNTLTTRVSNSETSIAWLNTNTWKTSTLLLREASLSSSYFRWNAGLLEVSVGFVTFAYVDGSLATRDNRINTAFSRIDITDNSLYQISLRTTIVEGNVTNLTTRVNTTDVSLNTLKSRYDKTEASLGNLTYIKFDACIGNLVNGLAATNSSLNILYAKVLTTDTSLNTLKLRYDKTDTSVGTLTGRVNAQDTSIAWLRNNTVKEASLGLDFYWSSGLLEVSVGIIRSYIDGSLNKYVKEASLGLDFYWSGGLLEVSVGIIKTYVDGSLNQYIKNSSLGTDFFWSGGYLEVSGGTGGGTPGGLTQTIQFNNAGSLDGDSSLMWNIARKQVGINAVNPSTMLDVGGTIRSVNQSAPSSGIGLELNYNPGVLSAAVMSYDRTTNVYMPITLRGSTTQIYGASNTTGRVIIDVSYGACIINEDSNDVDFRVESATNAEMFFVDGGANRVGIGTRYPMFEFDISTDTNGQVAFSDGTVSRPVITFRNDPDTGFYWASANQIRVATGGIWNFAFDTSVFHSDGDIIAYSTTTSDIRLKENIKDLESPLDKILQLKGISYNLKRSGKGHIGLIAQDVEKVIPLVVEEYNLPFEENDKELYKTIRYQELIPYLIESIKSLEYRIKILESK